MLRRLQEDGVHRAIAFTQYPQYSCSTTGSSLNELYRQSQKLMVASPSPIKWSVIDRWGMHPGFVEAVTSRIQSALTHFPPHRRDRAVLLFSAHSLPMSVVNRGDPYVAEVAMSVGQVMQRLANAGV